VKNKNQETDGYGRDKRQDRKTKTEGNNDN